MTAHETPLPAPASAPDPAHRSTAQTMLRFGGVGVLNTGIDFGLFALLHNHLGILVANLISTSAGMTFSFIVNGLFTFKSEKLTLRHAVTFISTTGFTLWVIQPIAIHLILSVMPHDLPIDVDRVILAKMSTIVICFVLNFAAYRYVVWPIEHKHDAEHGAGTDPDLAVG
ncbi:MAG: GtrA family protein [Marmoricola sp.]|nr:GtrA family protein [Marmoricola sp.]